MTIESFAQVIDDPRIDDIVICDDHSTDGSYSALMGSFYGNEKISIVRKLKNTGMSLNKRDAISHAKNEWCILFDSDNIICPDYLDAFYKFVPDSDSDNCKLLTNASNHNTIFCPDFAKPKFDYRKYNPYNIKFPLHGLFGKDECSQLIREDEFNCLMNTCNYVVHRDFYLATYKYNPAHKASDTIWHNYNHLKGGGDFIVVPNMQYFHRVHDGSGFMQDAQYNMAQADEVRKLIQQL